MFSINSTATYNRETGQYSVDGIILTEDQVRAIVTLYKQLESPFGEAAETESLQTYESDRVQMQKNREAQEFLQGKLESKQKVQKNGRNNEGNT